MYREKFNELVMHEVSLGFQRGMELFLESLNEEMEKDAFLAEGSLDEYVERLFEEAGA